MLPFSTIGEKFDDFARFAVAYALIAVYFIADVISLPEPFDVFTLIPFIIIAVYYWAMFRPTVLPAVFVFVLGVGLDIMTGTPLGMSAMVLVLLNWAISDQRAFLLAQSFPMIWLVFAVVYAAVMMAQWFVYGLINLQWNSILALFPEFIVGIVAFPFVVMPLYLAYRILPRTNFPLSLR